MEIPCVHIPNIRVDDVIIRSRPLTVCFVGSSEVPLDGYGGVLHGSFVRHMVVVVLQGSHLLTHTQTPTTLDQLHFM